MHGLILNLFKKPISQFSDQTLHSRKSDSSITWMHYDFIEPIYVSNYQQFFLQEESSIQTNHHGDMQSLILYYPLANHNPQLLFNHPLIVNNVKTAWACPAVMDEVNTIKDPPGFICVTSIKLRHCTESSFENDINHEDEIIKNLLHFFDNRAGVFENLTTIDFYRSIGVDDLVVITSSASIKCLISVVTLLRSCNKRTINSCVDTTYSFIFNNIINGSGLQSDTGMQISLTVLPTPESSKYIDELSLAFGGATYSCLLGKYDYFFDIKVPESQQINLAPYFDDGLLCSDNLYCERYVIQSKTNWTYDSNSIVSELVAAGFDIDVPDYPCECKLSDEELNRSLEIIKDRIEKIKGHDIFIRTPHLKKVFALLYQDFCKTIWSSYTSDWQDDVYVQFEVFLNIFEDIIKTHPNQVAYSVFESIVNEFRQTYTHITQANRVFFEVPATELRYTGSYSKVLKAYYGIIKELILFGYYLPRSTNNQAKITASVSFEYTPKVRTTRFIDTKYPNEDMFISFHLPFEALCNFPKYTSYLCHEVGHYIAPSDRTYRNRTLLNIIVTENLILNIQNGLSNIINTCSKEKKTFPSNTLLAYARYIAEFICEESSRQIEAISSGIEESIHAHALLSKDKYLSNIDYVPLADFLLVLEEILSEDNHVTFAFYTSFIELVKKLRTTNKRWIDNQISETDRKVLNEFCHLVSAWESEKQPLLVEFVSYQKRSDNEIVDFIGMLEFAVKESSADLFAVAILHMDFDQYIDFMFCFLYENCAEDNMHEMEDILYLRIGMVIDVICKMGSLESQLKKLDFLVENSKQKLKPSQYTNRHVDDHELDFFKARIAFISIIEQGLIKYHRRFSRYRRQLFNMNISNDYSKNESNRLECLRVAYQNYYEKLSAPALSNDNIKILELFQSQESFRSLFRNPSQTSQYRFGTKSVKNVPSFYTEEAIFAVGTLEDYIIEVKRGTAHLSCNDESNMSEQNYSSIWFRGHNNINHKLIPGIYRPNIFNSKICPCMMLEAYMNEFESKTHGAKEFSRVGYQNPIETLANMQHYGLPTNLLDWSENALSALFFALSDEKCENTTQDACVYLLNPAKMNLARREMIKLSNCCALDHEYPIINLSVPLHAEELEDFLSVPITTSQMFAEKYKKWMRPRLRSRAQWWPIACITSLNNPRIQAQQGTFTAFNVMAKVSSGNKLSIESLQNAYLKKCPKGQPFLYKIIIKKEAKDEMLGELARTGVFDIKIYPDLERTCKHIKGKVAQFYK